MKTSALFVCQDVSDFRDVAWAVAEKRDDIVNYF